MNEWKTEDIVDYFLEIAIGSQYGQKNIQLHKWNHDVLFQVNGDVTAEDTSTLESVVAELNGLVQGITIKRVTHAPKTKIYFAPPSGFVRIVPTYKPPNTAFYWSRWNANSITESTILIASKDISQEKRNHHIRAMLTKNLGLMNRSDKDPTSLFFTKPAESTGFTAIDRLLVRLLYHPYIKHNMTVSEVRQALASHPYPFE